MNHKVHSLIIFMANSFWLSPLSNSNQPGSIRLVVAKKLLILSMRIFVHYAHAFRIQWTLANPNSLGPEPIQISEIFGLAKATAAMCVIVTAPYLHSVLGSLGSLPLLHVHKTHNTAPKLSFSTLLLHLTCKT